MSVEKEDVIIQLQKVFGSVPDETRNILQAIVHPEVIEATKEYVRSSDERAQCLIYTYPWDCVKEAEALYENIKYGWTGGTAGAKYDDGWCVNCKQRVTMG